VKLEAIREELHRAVDEILDRHLGAGAPRPPRGGGAGAVEFEGDNGPWTYRWPGSGGVEKFYESRWYKLATSNGRRRVLVAWAVRSSWGKADRRRAIVFLQQGDADSQRFYPWTEFVETDDGRYAAPLVDPTRPRKMLADGEPLPHRFDGLTVERSDRLFDSIQDGPSLRLVVDATDEVAMVEHGYWVATLRRRI
jgi:hypothetical protein